MFELVMRKAALPSVKYLAFDFHEECKGLKFENVYRLVDSIEGDTSKIGYTWIDEQACFFFLRVGGRWLLTTRLPSYHRRLASLSRSRMVLTASTAWIRWIAPI